MSHLASSFTNFIKGLSKSSNSVHEGLNSEQPLYADGGTLYHLRHPHPGERPDPRKHFDQFPQPPRKSSSGSRSKSPANNRSPLPMDSPAKLPPDLSASCSHGSLALNRSSLGPDSGHTTASSTSPSDGYISLRAPNRRRSSTFSGNKKRPLQGGRGKGSPRSGSPRTGSPKASYAATNAHPPIISAYHSLMLQRAFRNISQHGDASCGKLIFKHLLQKRPEIKGLFAFPPHKSITDLGNEDVLYRNHAKIFADALRRVIESLDRDLNSAVAYLQEQARYHANFAECGMVAAHWDAMGEAMDECVLEWGSGQGRAGPGRANLETNKAWLIAISFIVDTMRVEFERELRRRRGESSRRNSGSSSNASSSVPPGSRDRRASLMTSPDTNGIPQPPTILFRGVSRSHEDIYAPSCTPRKYSDTARLQAILSNPMVHSSANSVRKMSDSGVIASAPAAKQLMSPRSSLLKTDFSADRRASLPNAPTKTTREIIEDFGLTIEHVD